MIVDIDILDIDSKIIRSFDDDKCKIDDYDNRKMELEDSLKLNCLTQRTIKSIQESIRELSDHIEDIRSNRTYNYYIIESAEILEKYKNILKQPQKVNFIGKAIKNNKEKNKLVQQYIEIASKYVTIELESKDKHSPLVKKEKKITCNNCNNNNY